ncbi:histidine kinase dimerization/phosphoacceptor domain -containing protein [Emcibacter sp. SYSU 3D8]|uniref:sensor histidine kinase n=1 Tax=Emcibacter sp. SYSU 3D8 TaxID=3133969 RepID=UPI0031FF213B
MNPPIDTPHPFTKVADAHLLAQAIVDTVREPLLVLDQELRVVAASRSFYVIFQMQQQEVEGRAIYMLGNAKWDIPELRVLLEQILPEQSVMEGYQVEHDFAGTGHRIMLLNARSVYFESSAERLILLAMEDVTEWRAAERLAQDMLQQSKMLLQEMQHRVANSLQIIASILMLKARRVQSEETRLHLRDAHQRVMSVAAVQEQLQASAHGDSIELAPYLNRLCETLAGSMIGDARPIALLVRAQAGTALSHEAVSIGLIVTELVINALKHAFPDDTPGAEIIVSYDTNDTGWRLSVTDNGCGKAPAADGAKAGLGTSLVDALSNQLDASVGVSSSPKGTRVTITHSIFTPQLSDAA